MSNLLSLFLEHYVHVPKSGMNVRHSLPSELSGFICAKKTQDMSSCNVVYGESMDNYEIPSNWSTEVDNNLI